MKDLLFSVSFAEKVGHGTKDCDDDVDNEEHEIRYVGWLKASPWKVGLGSAESSEDVGKRSSARALFITKPKANAGEMEHKGVEDVVDRMTRWELKEGKKVVEKQGDDRNKSTMRDEPIIMVEQNVERLASQVEEVPSPARDTSVKEGGSTKKVEKKWKRVGNKNSDKMKVGEVFGGTKRKSREGDGSGIDEMEIEEMRATKKMGVIIVPRREDDVSETENVAGPTGWAPGGQ